MSETKFTPGPWRYDYEDGYCGEIIASTGKTVATFTDEPSAQDAHLIAAAPDMYEELECARDVFRFYQSHHEFKGGSEKAIRNKEIADRIDRLLAKARGEV
jgi:hypothetical protein